MERVMFCPECYGLGSLASQISESYTSMVDMANFYAESKCRTCDGWGTVLVRILEPGKQKATIAGADHATA